MLSSMWFYAIGLYMGASLFASSLNEQEFDCQAEWPSAHILIITDLWCADGTDS